jgi:hypothetical protein
MKLNKGKSAKRGVHTNFYSRPAESEGICLMKVLFEIALWVRMGSFDGSLDANG